VAYIVFLTVNVNKCEFTQKKSLNVTRKISLNTLLMLFKCTVLVYKNIQHSNSP